MIKPILALAAAAAAVSAMPARAATITPVAVTASSTQRNYSADKLINGSGLSGDGMHNGDWSAMWMTQQGQGANQGWLVFDLGAAYKLTGVDMWQYNFLSPPFIPGVINTIYRGTEDFTLSTSLDGITFDSVLNGSMVLGDGEPVSATNFSFDATAQYVRIDLNDNLVPDGYLEDTYPTYGVGLSEVRFTSAVPEPATWMMMIVGFGLVGGVMRRKQQAQVRYNFA